MDQARVPDWWWDVLYTALIHRTTITTALLGVLVGASVWYLRRD